jgi:hypothetical protein
MFNIVIGICWQTSLVALPVYIVIRSTGAALASFAVATVTTAILKFTWYDHLRETEEGTEHAERQEPVPSLSSHA